MTALAPPKRSHFAGVRTEAAVATASAFGEPATAVGCGTLGAGDQVRQFFGEAPVDGVEKSGGAIAHHHSAVFRRSDRLKPGTPVIFRPASERSRAEEWGMISRHRSSSLNRLASAQAANGSWGQSYTYDGFGNLTDQNVIAGSAPSWHTVYDPATNHAPCTDANGNSNIGGLGCSATPYLYDIENRLTGQSTMFSSGGYQYGYAPGNKRVWKAVCCDSSSNPIEEITFWSVTGQKLATYQLVSTPVQMVPTT